MAQKKRSRDPDVRREKQPAVEEDESSSQEEAERDRQVDDPADQEDLNRELWEFAKHSSYQSILPYVAEAQRISKANQRDEAELPTGWRIAPAGTQIEVGRLPYEAVEFAGKLVVLDTGYYYQEPQAVSIVDPPSARVIKTVRFDSLFPSAVVAQDSLFISGGFDQKVYRLDQTFDRVGEYKVGGFVGGLAVIDAEHLAVGYMAIKGPNGDFEGGGLAVLNIKSGQIERQTSAGYYPYSVRFAQGKIFVTVLGEDKLLIFDRDLHRLKSVTLGRTPQEACTDGQRLYVANTGADSISVIDAHTGRLVHNISVAERGSRFGVAPSSCTVYGERLYVTLADTNAVAVFNRTTGRREGSIPTGWYPTRVIADRDNVYVLSAKGIRSRRPNPKGPPGAVASNTGDYVLKLLNGSVSIIARSEIDAHQRQWMKQVDESGPLFDRKGFRLPIKYVFYIIKENRTYDQVLGDLPRGNGDPKLTFFGEETTPVQHQLSREFVTLDNFFCDGEISVLGHSFTTSGYASPFLEWFGNLTYSNRWNSKDNPCATQKAKCASSQYPFGMVPATTSPAYLWDRLDEKGVDYRIYGENYFLFTRAYKIFTDLYGPQGKLARKFYEHVVKVAAKGEDRGKEFNLLAQPYADRAKTRADAYLLLGDHGFASRLSHFLTGDFTFAEVLKHDDRLRRNFADYLYHYPFGFRSWDLRYSDLDRAREWKKDFAVQLHLNHVAPFQYIWLPNDHTDGASKKIRDAFQFVAQNDAAVGNVIDTISHSPIWARSLILIVEDDAQNGPDHVDATRTIAFAAGPYVKRGAVISDRYDQLSMLRTIEMVLGLEPLNLGDRMAAPMFAIFSSTPELKSFNPERVSDRLAPVDKQAYQELTR